MQFTNAERDQVRRVWQQLREEGREAHGLALGKACLAAGVWSGDESAASSRAASFVAQEAARARFDTDDPAELEAIEIWTFRRDPDDDDPADAARRWEDAPAAVRHWVQEQAALKARKPASNYH